MEINRIGSHDEICSGYSYDYEIKWGKYGNTLKDFLKELKEYSLEQSFRRLDDFGDPNKTSPFGGYWGIYVNDKIYRSLWLGERNKEELPDYRKFYDGDESEEVLEAHGGGGWCCGINIYISVASKN